MNTIAKTVLLILSTTGAMLGKPLDFEAKEKTVSVVAASKLESAQFTYTSASHFIADLPNGVQIVAFKEQKDTSVAYCRYKDRLIVFGVRKSGNLNSLTYSIEPSAEFDENSKIFTPMLRVKFRAGLDSVTRVLMGESVEVKPQVDGHITVNHKLPTDDEGGQETVSETLYWESSSGDTK